MHPIFLAIELFVCPQDMEASFLAIAFCWFVPSALLSTWANTTFLLTFKDPVLHTLVRFFAAAIIGTSFLVVSGSVKPNEVFKVVKDVSIPAILLWCANYTNSIALQHAGITLTYVMKASIPAFTVLICTAMGQKFTTMIYISLIPICVGVALACMGDLSFSAVGAAAALCSTLCQTCMNISIKSVRSRTGYSGMKAFMGMAIVASALSVPMTMATCMLFPDQASPMDKLRGAYLAGTQNGDYWPIGLVIAAALAYYTEYTLNFVFVGYVNSVAFSVCDIARRVAIIVMGSFLFNKFLTPLNWVGITVALSGVLWYSYLENQSKPKEKSK